MSRTKSPSSGGWCGLSCLLSLTEAGAGTVRLSGAETAVFLFIPYTFSFGWVILHPSQHTHLLLPHIYPPPTPPTPILFTPPTQSLSRHRLKSSSPCGNAWWHRREISLLVLLLCNCLPPFSHIRLFSSPPLRISTPPTFAPILGSGFKRWLWASGDVCINVRLQRRVPSLASWFLRPCHDAEDADDVWRRRMGCWSCSGLLCIWMAMYDCLQVHQFGPEWNIL